MTYPEPTSHCVDTTNGNLSGPTGTYEKRLTDLEGLYADGAAFQAADSAFGQKIVYRVCEVRPAAKASDLIFGTTFMEPGQIGSEFYLTRGHIHARANRPETYYGEAGEGVMLLESPEGETRVLEIAPRTMIYVPPYWIHRSVNTGAGPLVMSFCYPCDSGQDYGVIARSGGMAKRIVSDGTGWTAVDNVDYRPRTSTEIEAILATRG